MLKYFETNSVHTLKVLESYVTLVWFIEAFCGPLGFPLIMESLHDFYCIIPKFCVCVLYLDFFVYHTQIFFMSHTQIVFGVPHPYFVCAIPRLFCVPYPDFLCTIPRFFACVLHTDFFVLQPDLFSFTTLFFHVSHPFFFYVPHPNFFSMCFT